MSSFVQCTAPEEMGKNLSEDLVIRTLNRHQLQKKRHLAESLKNLQACL